MARQLDVCIRGGGIVGHVLALLLARERLRVGLVATPAAGTDVRAYALNRLSRDLLEAVGCWPDAAAATPVNGMQVHETGGGTVAFDAAQQGVEALAWIVDVPVLERQLAQAVQFQPQVERLEAPRDATLTVVCEGRASATRGAWAGEPDVTRYDQWAIAARVRCEMPHGQQAFQWFTPRDILGMLPMEGQGGTLMAVVWSVHDAQKTTLMEMDDDQFADKLRQACDKRFGKLVLQGARAAWPLQLALARHWTGRQDGRAWVLAGDAAHTVHPLAGQGLNLGLADVRELAQQISARDYWRGVDDNALLRRYERARKADVALMGAATDGLQQLFSRSGGGWQSVRHWGMRGFERSGWLKSLVARQAMGLPWSTTKTQTGSDGPQYGTGSR